MDQLFLYDVLKVVVNLTIISDLRLRNELMEAENYAVHVFLSVAQ